MGSPALVRDAQAEARRLARDLPDAAAVAWVHSAAVARHSVGLGLVDDRGDTVDNIKALADTHPALAGFVDPAVNPAWTVPVPDLDPVDRLWAAHAVDDRPARTDGYLLGDLYQALSEEARKGRALCQTPQFVTSLLLDLAFDPAAKRWGADVRMVDPACGTGHILIETFIRAWIHLRHAMWPASQDEAIGGALAATAGVELDPYAALVARYRLLALACRMNGGRRRLVDAPASWRPQVVAANSLLDDHPLLTRGRYHVVVGNPPYITVKDPTVNEQIRARYPRVCSGKYSLALPFFQLMTDLLVPGGWCAQLTANSFMKREFGRKFVEGYLAGLDLRWVIDTSGAYIPGHGTPTVILVHRNQPPAGDTVAAVMGVRGEPSQPADPARGKVWTAIEKVVRDKLSYQLLAAGVRVAQEAAQGETAAPVAPAPAVGPPAPRVGQLDLFDLLDAA